jgi:CRISPR-associated protein Csx17
MSTALTVVHCAGIRPESLGHYLVGLGLLAATARRWPDIRGCWRNGHFVLVGQDLNAPAIEDYLLSTWEPTPYQRWWKDAQARDTKVKADRHIWQARSRQEAGLVRLLDCHIIGAGRNQFNPVFGTGGNIGRRDLARVFNDAQALLATRHREKAPWLAATLHGAGDRPLPDLRSAGTWFVYANKTFNSGQSWYREGYLSPWSFLLAMEGALLLTGGVGRRLGSRARPYAVFPFVTDVPSPASAEEVGLTRAEFWAPLWEHPANLAELQALLQRGVARVGRQAAEAPHEFAVAAMAAGVDAGVGMFVRFALRQTTSSQVYEATPRERIAVHPSHRTEASLLMPLVPWLKRLPYEPRGGQQKGAFRGVRGPIEAAIIAVAERPEAPERWQLLLQSLAHGQARIDRNKDLRTRCPALPWLTPAWFTRAWPSPPAELRVARAIASVGAGTAMPILVNIYGVELDQRGAPRFDGDQRSQRAVWHSGAPTRTMADVLERRLVDVEPLEPLEPLPLGGASPCPADLIAAFLAGIVDLDEVARWVPPLSLINWHHRQPRDREEPATGPSRPSDGAYLLQALFRPLFHPGPLRIDEADLVPKPLVARRLCHLICQEDWEAAIELARDRYRAAGRLTVAPPPSIRAYGERLAAALLVPMDNPDVTVGIRRWLEPLKSVNP